MRLAPAHDRTRRSSVPSAWACQSDIYAICDCLCFGARPVAYRQTVFGTGAGTNRYNIPTEKHGRPARSE